MDYKEPDDFRQFQGLLPGRKPLNLNYTKYVPQSFFTCTAISNLPECEIKLVGLFHLCGCFDTNLY